MGIFSSIIGLFTGGVGKMALDGLLNLVRVYVTNEDKRAELEAEITEKWIDAQVQSALIRKDAFGDWAKFFAASFLVGPVVWWNAVFITSTFNLHWNVLALPADFYPWMATIIGAVFFSPSINGVIGGLLKKL